MTPFDKDKINHILTCFDTDSLERGLKSFGYFGDLDAPRLCYLIPHTGKLTDWNALLQRAFPEYRNIHDNAYPVFVPHITLFKIRNTGIFLSVRKELENIMREELEKLASVDIFDRIALFVVNSRFRPEIQVEVDIK